MNRLKVLMLGWEFPPIINGGLGIASQGIAKALSSVVDLTMILPKTSANYVLDNVDLIGINSLNLEHLKEEISHSETVIVGTKSVIVPVDLLPYQPVYESEIEIQEEIQEQLNHNFPEINQEDIKSFAGEIYGNDIWEKIDKYAKIATNIAATKEFDVIHAHDWMTFLAGLTIKEKFGKPLVLHIHSLETDRAGIGSRGSVYQLEQYAAQQADAIIAVSQYTASVLVHHYGIDADKITVVHNGIEPISAFKTEKPFPEKLVVFLGRLTGQKGPDYFLETAQKVMLAYPNVRFVIAGTGEKLKALIETGAYKQLGTRLHFTGFSPREKVFEMLSMADVYCMPSVSEPFGLSALEAASFGVPIVISNQAGVSEVLPSALRADFWDVIGMARQIVSLLRDKELSNQKVKEAYKDLEEVSWAFAAEKSVALYEKLLS